MERRIRYVRKILYVTINMADVNTYNFYVREECLTDLVSSEDLPKMKPNSSVSVLAVQNVRCDENSQVFLLPVDKWSFITSDMIS